MATPNPFALLNFSRHKSEEALDTPYFSVVKGNPTDEEVAALTAAVLALQSAPKAEDKSAAALWNRTLNRGQGLGVRLRPGPGSWRRARPQ